MEYVFFTTVVLVATFEPELRKYVSLLRLRYKVATFEPELQEYVSFVVLQSCDFRAGELKPVLWGDPLRH